MTSFEIAVGMALDYSGAQFKRSSDFSGGVIFVECEFKKLVFRVEAIHTPLSRAREPS